MMNEIAIKIGRSPDNSIVINDASVSRNHIKLVLNEDDVVRLIDLNSTNGTFINGRRVLESIISEADEVKLGEYILSSEEIRSSILKVKHENNDYKEEFLQVLEKISEYEVLKNKVLKNSQALVKKSIISLVIVGGVSFLPGISPTIKIVAISVFTPIVFFFFDESPDKKQKDLDKLKSDFEDKLICPKCKMSLMNATSSYWITKKECTNAKCKAKWQ
ncbi:MAG TPA: FHA domain-containing protein [Saprospiraceae bacterium]|nr:FHA domain-containing protein [Saprospiraceae bacterium]